MAESLRMAFRTSANERRGSRMPTVLTQTVECSSARRLKRCWQREGWTPQSAEKTVKFIWGSPCGAYP
jgi:hypothetical protein